MYKAETTPRHSFLRLMGGTAVAATVLTVAQAATASPDPVIGLVAEWETRWNAAVEAENAVRAAHRAIEALGFTHSRPFIQGGDTFSRIIQIDTYYQPMIAKGVVNAQQTRDTRAHREAKGPARTWCR
jgi:hypothetical protein